MTTQLGLVAAIVTSLSGVSMHAAQDGASTAATRNLIKSLNDASLEAIATVDPTEPGAFVAALHIKGSELLVVRASDRSVDALAAHVAARQFRDVYIDLQATPATKGKVFVMDSGADGLPADADQPANVDVVYEDGTRQTIFNGARAQKVNDDEYRKQLRDADVKYTRLLTLLNAAMVTHLSAQQVPRLS